jgi:hypothetical protein
LKDSGATRRGGAAALWHASVAEPTRSMKATSGMQERINQNRG